MNSQQMLKRSWQWAGSRELSVIILVMCLIYVLIPAIFSCLIPSKWLDIISGLLPYKVLYALFFINLIIAEIRWIPIVIGQCAMANAPDTPEKLQTFRHATAVPGPGFSVPAFEQYLKRRGFKVRNTAGPAGAPLLYACRGRFSPIGNLLVHASFLLLLAGILTSLLFRFEGAATLTESQSFSGGRAAYKSIAASPLATLPEVDFDVEKISANFWQGRMFFTRLDAELLHRGGRELTGINSAATVGNSDVTLASYGYAPMYVLKNSKGEIIDQGYVTLNIIAPGSEDAFKVPGYPHLIRVSFYPDHAEVAGKMTTRSMNPVNPIYSVRIFRGRLLLYSGLVKPGEWLDYDGLRLSFPSFARWGDFRVVSDPGYPLIWAAFIMLGIGLVWKLLFYRKEVVLWRDGEGRFRLAGRFAYYQKLHAGWLASLARKFGGGAA